VHHLDDWALGGETNLDRLCSLCLYHHRRNHDRAFVIRGRPSTGLWFETPDGRPILPPERRVDPTVPRDQALRGALPDGDQLRIDAATPGRRDVTARMDLGYVVSAVLDGVERARRVGVTATAGP
jgi:hypothetical protein